MWINSLIHYIYMYVLMDIVRYGYIVAELGFCIYKAAMYTHLNTFFPYNIHYMYTWLNKEIENSYSNQFICVCVCLATSKSRRRRNRIKYIRISIRNQFVSTAERFIIGLWCDVMWCARGVKIKEKAADLYVLYVDNCLIKFWANLMQMNCIDFIGIVFELNENQRINRGVKSWLEGMGFCWRTRHCLLWLYEQSKAIVIEFVLCWIKTVFSFNENE